MEKARDNPSANGNDEPIDIPGLGSFTPSQIKAGAQAFLGKAKAGEVQIEAPGGMGALQKLAQGKNVGFMDALPFIMQIFGPGNTQNGQQPQQSRTPPGANWDN